MRLVVSPRAVRDTKGIPKRRQTRLIAALERLGADPRDPGLDIKMLAGRRPWMRMRVGDYRVLFRLKKSPSAVWVARVIDRKELERAITSME